MNTTMTEEMFNILYKDKTPTNLPDEEVEPLNPPEGIAPSSCEISKKTPNVTCVPTH